MIVSMFLKCIIGLNIHLNLKLKWIENYDTKKKKKDASCAHEACAMRLIFINDILPFPFEILIYTTNNLLWTFMSATVSYKCMCLPIHQVFVNISWT